MAEAVIWRSEHGETTSFWCPACVALHSVATGLDSGGWSWNGSWDRPTFTPSILVYPVEEIGQPRCHSHVTDGRIAYCSDCSHAMCGQVVDLPAFGDLKSRIHEQFGAQEVRKALSG